MKKIFVMAISILLLFIIIGQAQTDSSPFEVTSVLSAPHLSAGDRNVGIEFTVQNNRDISYDNVKVYLFLRYPFSASLPPNNKLGEINYPGYLISSGGSGDEYTQYFNLGAMRSHTTFFKIDVDRNAKYGAYDLPYTIFYGSKEYHGKITLAIKGDTLIEIKNFSTESRNPQVEPGEIFKIYINFENVGDNEIKWLKLTLIPDDKVLVPMSSASEIIFKNIPPGSNNGTEMMFSLEKDAPAKNYPLDLVLNYVDERGIEYNETKLVGIAAVGRANMDIAKKTTDPARIEENQPFILTLKIENTGTGDAKGVTAQFGSAFEGDTLAYLGEIKKDDYSNAIFSLDGMPSGKKEGVLKISYEDDTGKHEITKDIILIINPADSQNPLPIVILTLIAVVLGIFWMRRKH